MPEPRIRSRPATPSSTRPDDAAAPWLTDDDLHLFNEGTHRSLYEKLGAHRVATEGRTGVQFAVWAPTARAVSVIGDFNGWDRDRNPMTPRASSGIWEAFVPDLETGTTYKYAIRPRDGGHVLEKADPVGFAHEVPPRTASVVRDLDYVWGDDAWMADRAKRQTVHAPISIYEMHVGSWRHLDDGTHRSLGYRALADVLPAYLRERGFTHVEFLPLMEHPLYKSWGYQSTGYFAPTSRFGTPQDLMHLVDRLHQAGIGVILDWVPSHFPIDGHALAQFDGTHLYEHADPREGFHPDWTSAIFNYGRHEVRSFLISSALYWLDRFHVDGLRVDGVASMLYRDYSRAEGEWIPNVYGGRENLEAVEFLQKLNIAVYERFPDVTTIAEESTAWPGVSRPTWVGGLGFGFKWDMGWMHDTLVHLGREPVHRKYHYGEITFRGLYQFSENYVLPLSHDEVVHGKGSLIGRLPGDEWQRFANLRLLLAMQWAQPGKKLLFMGSEIAQHGEWDVDHELDWHLLEHPPHLGIQRLVTELNRLYRHEPALHEFDCDPQGFAWTQCDDAEQSVMSFLRFGATPSATVLVVFNLTPVVRSAYRVGVPRMGRWTEILNTDATDFAGSGVGNLGGADAQATPWHGQPCSVCLTLPPLGALYLKGPDAT